MIRPTAALIAIALVATAHAQTKPTVKALINAATAKAAKSHRNVLVVFRSERCGWCNELDKFLNDKSIAPLIDSQYVRVQVRIDYFSANKALETPGGLDYFRTVAQPHTATPFYAVLNDRGEVIGDAYRRTEGKPPKNTGYPNEPWEIATFMNVLKTTSTLSDADRDSVEAWLKRHSRKL